MAFMGGRERALAAAVARLATCNPFLPERVEAEREALGRHFVSAGVVWHPRADRQPENPNVARLNEEVQALSAKLRERFVRGARASSEEASLYEDLVLYRLYTRYEADFYHVVASRSAATGRIGFYARFGEELRSYLGIPGANFPAAQEPAHVFALFFQIRRAFHFIFRNIIGGSAPAARLRAAVWQSIFTHDLRRYRRSLYERMGDAATLITGASGTGKELVAQAIGRARYIAFDPGRQAFVQDFAELYYPLNLSAFPATLIESELFGHKRGAFTGAAQDRPGWLEVCPAAGTVFLDEIAEVDVAIQVKLLRVLQTRTFQRLGDTQTRHFQGKVIAATNRDLAAEMQAGRFREDLYYRLCADVIEAPSLDAQLRDSPAELPNLLLFLAHRIAGEAEAASLADETERWIHTQLRRDYRWPGNVRELEQCVRNVMIRGEYRPPRREPTSATDRLLEGFLAGGLTAEALLRRYCTLVYARTGSYQETARRLGLDRRTVKDRIDRELLATFQADRRSRTVERQGRASASDPA